MSLRQGSTVRHVTVLGISGQRGPAPVAQKLYEETAESIAAQEEAREQRRLGSEPALTIAQGRPTKRERRDLDGATHGWGSRWSASVDGDDGS